MALRLRIEHGQDAGKTYRLATAGVYRAGRSPQGSFQVLDMKVSKDHFELIVDAAGAVVIRDLASTHGTLLNGQKVDGSKPMSTGDEIRVGLTVLRLLADGPADLELRPVAATPSAAPAGPAGPSSTGGGATSSVVRAGNGGSPPKATVNDPLVGTTLAGYRVVERVGAGGMGAVYRAEQLSLHREVALKVLAEKLVSDSAFVDQFINEARAAGQLNHPNVVQVYDVGHADGRHYFSMEYIHGGSLEDKIPKTGGVPWEDVLPWFLDAANALIFAEKKGILHRDIKPDNFMVGQDGSVKLCDLGLAKKSESADLLAQGIIGTPHFIAPESIRRKTEVDPRADLYSLGCCFYRLLTGKNPFPAGSVKDILLAHLNQPPPHASAAATGVPKELDEIVARLMQKDPAARFQSAKDLWEALDKVRLQFGMEAHGLHPGRAKKLAILAGVVAAGAVAALLILKPWEKPPPERIKGETVTVKTGVEQATLDEQAAKADFNEIETERLETVGKIDEGDSWNKPGWTGIIEKLRALALKYPATEAGKKAKTTADEFEQKIAAKRAASLDQQKAFSAAEVAVKNAVKAAQAAAEAKAAANDPLGAEREIDAGIAAAREAAKAEWKGRVLLPAAAVDGAIAPLETLRTTIAKGVTAAWETADAAASTASEGGSAEALAKAIGLYTAWIDAHPDAGTTGEVARAWNQTTRDAMSRRTALQALQAKALLADYLADRQSYFDLIAKELYTPRADDGSGGGLYVRFQFTEAAQKAAARGATARTQPYRDLFASREREARAMAKLPGLLAAGFGTKGFKDKLVGRGWNGNVKGITAEGVMVGDKLRPFADEGFAWFHELFYEKGAERYPLAADDHEALAQLCVASGILEGAAGFDDADKEWSKAIELDAARKASLEGHKTALAGERAIRKLLDDSDALVEKIDADLAAFQRDFAPYPDLKKSDAARKAVRDAEADLRGRLAAARAKVVEAERNFPTTVGRALLGDTPPPGATYAGERLPTANEPPPSPARPPTPAAPPTPTPTPAPGMGETPPPTPTPGPAMGEAPPAMGEPTAPAPAMADAAGGMDATLPPSGAPPSTGPK